MSRLTKRVEKLEGGNSHIEIVYVPSDSTGDEREAAVQKHLRSKGLPPDTVAICFTPEDAEL